MATHQQTIRRGLPRRPGGPAWPDVADAVAAQAAVDEAAAPVPELEADAAAEQPAASTASEPVAAAPAPAAGAAVETEEIEVALRRGLPRVAGGEPWPPVATATVQREVRTAPVAAEPVEPTMETPSSPQIPAATAAPMAAPATSTTPPATTATPASSPKPAEPTGPGTTAKWVRRGVLGTLGIVAAAGVIVLAARGVTTLPGVPEFLERYPGSYELPESAPVGFPAWLNVVHYLNFFFMVLIVRSGLEVRYQKKPPAYWTSRRGNKVSLSVWLHTSLDLLWLLNGLVFVVLLFVTGQWMRIVPTSWEVFPNAMSAALQYLTLDWPVEDGWVHFNSLQQLMYFLVVFVAAPLAALTGARMSDWWPKKAARLNTIYPASVARAVHFPTMLFFVLFVIVHVVLVLSTGALRNLNHMYAAQDTTSWTGFAWFAGGLALVVAAVLAARPLLVAPIASIFGKVSSR